MVDMRKKVAVLPGDGIGPEVMEAAVKILQVIGRRYKWTFDVEFGAIGGDAIEKYNSPFPEETRTLCENSDAVLLGAVGGPKWDQNPPEMRPEKGLLALRKHFDLFANLRPVDAIPALLKASPLKEEVAREVNLLIVRELTGGLYFGEPSRKTEKSAVDTLVYTREEIERIVDKAFEFARLRKGKLTSVDKENVLQSSKLWREVVKEKAKGYPDVEVEHMLVDSAAMQLVTNPSAFDVVVTENMFGDILSDEASVITGSLGVMPSASLGADGFGVYEPVHGSAPQLTGLGKANPAASILSVAMMLKYSFGLEEAASAVEEAVYAVFNDDCFTEDVASEDQRALSTAEWTEKVIHELDLQSVSDDIMFTYI